MDNVIAMDVDASFPDTSYLTTIQSLTGQTPGEKYREFNIIINRIIHTYQESGNHIDDLFIIFNVPLAIIPYARVTIARELKFRDIILESLASTYLPIVNQALRAKWFFNGTSEEVTVSYFFGQVFPLVSLRTRSKIIKALAQGMRALESQSKADQFFKALLDEFSLAQAMPFLAYCSEKYIALVIAEYDIKLSVKMLDLVYRRHPSLALNYLYYGKYLTSSEEERKKHKINILKYKSFILRLIKSHPQHFLIFFNTMNNPFIDKKINKTYVRYLCQNAAYALVSDPNKYLPNLNLKAVYYNLSKDDFAQMYHNLFPDNIRKFNIFEMLSYLRYYPKSQRLKFMMDQYELKYVNNQCRNFLRNQIPLDIIVKIQELLTIEEYEKLFSSSEMFPNSMHYFDIHLMMSYLMYHPRERQLNLLRSSFIQTFKSDILKHPQYLRSEKFLRLLPKNERIMLAQKIIDLSNNPSYSNQWQYYLSIEDLFKVYREKIATLPMQNRLEYFKKMISVCEINNDQTYLLEVLNHFETRYRNVQPNIMHTFFDYFTDKFEIKDLDSPCFEIFCKIVQRAYVKDKLYSASSNVLEKIFDGITHRLFIQLKQQIVKSEVSFTLEKMIDMYLEYKIEWQNLKWKILQHTPELELECIGMIAHRIPQKYPDDHSIWQESVNKIEVLKNLIIKLFEYNTKLKHNALANGLSEEEALKQFTRIKHYPWLMKSTIDLLLNNKESHVDDLKQYLKDYDTEFYYSIVNESVKLDYCKEITSGRAFILLRKNVELFLLNWEAYYLASRELLHLNSKAAKKFIITLKWYNELPMKFIERSLREIDQPGSVIILGIFLEGRNLEKILLTLQPTGPEVGIEEVNARKQYRLAASIPKAINVSMPPVSPDVLFPLFQGEYISLAVQSVDNFTQRLQKSKVLALAHKLMNDPSMAVNRHGCRLILKVVTNKELHEIILQILQDRHHQPSVVESIAKKLQHRFIASPTQENWSLLEICIKALRKGDIGAIRVLCNLRTMSGNALVIQYVEKLLARIEKLEVKHCMEKELKDDFIKVMMNTMTSSVAMWLPSQIVLSLIRMYYFDPPSQDVSSAVRNFALKAINRPYVPPV